MDFDDSAEEAAFREEARAWLEANVPPRSGRSGEALIFADVEDAEFVATGKVWQRTLYEGGWAGLGWPKEYGGRGAALMERVIWGQECARVGTPVPVNIIGEGMAGPTIIAMGTEDQKRRFLEPMLRGDEVWCQLFSEPGAGSDLGACQTRADRDGDEWVVNGQKVWTSAAHYADWGVLIARTDWDAPKHRGITYFVVDMASPGVAVRPLRQMTGGASFNEVYLDDVRVPDDLRIGPVDGGWPVAVNTLMNERMSLGASGLTGGLGYDDFFDFLQRPRPGGRRLTDDPVVRQLAARLYSQAHALTWTGYRALSRLKQGFMPGAEGSVAKLAVSRIARDAVALFTATLGADLVAGPEGVDGGEVAQWREMLLFAPAAHIAGGTDQVQRNIIGERVLGLPPEPRTDKAVPFREVPVSTQTP